MRRLGSIVSAVLVLATLGVASGAQARELLVEAPDGAVVNLALYPDAGESSRALAVLREAGRAITEEDGPVFLGIGGFPARAGPVGEEGMLHIRLGALRLEAPEGAHGRYGILDPQTGLLLSPIVVGETLALPAGDWVLRRDLGHETIPVTLDPGETATLRFGAAKRAREPSEPAPAYFARPEDPTVRATLPAGVDAVALLPGDWRVAAGPDLPPGEISIDPGTTTEITVAELLIRAPNPEPAVARLGDEPLIVVPNAAPTVIMGMPRPIVEIDGLGALPVRTDRPEEIWRDDRGRFPRIDGIAVAFAGDAPPVLVPGRATAIEVELLSPARIEVALVQLDRSGAIEIEAGAGRQRIDLAVPESFVPGSPGAAEVVVTRPDGVVLRGRSPERRVHKPPTGTVADVRVADVSPTTVTLAWAPTPDPSVAGYNVRRGERLDPLNGEMPIAVARFNDIGLSAGREYAYRICPVDTLGFEGPCVDVRARTPSP